MLETGEEKLEKAIAKEKEFNQNLEKTINIVDSTKEGIKNIEEFADRFDYLQSLAEKGLLTEDLQTEYEGYLKEVQKYNEDAMISYNEQGKLMTNNRNLMAETVELQKELIKEQLKEQFSDDKWDEYTENWNDKLIASQKIIDEAYDDIDDDLDYTKFSGTKRVSRNGKAKMAGKMIKLDLSKVQPQTVNEMLGKYYKKGFGVGVGYDFNKSDLVKEMRANIEADKENIYERVKTYAEEANLDWDEKTLLENSEKVYQEILANAEKSAEAYQQLDEAYKKHGKNLQKNSSVIANFIKNNSDSAEDYNKLLKSIGEDNASVLDSIYEEYINKHKIQGEETLDIIKDELIKFQQDFYDLLENNGEIKSIYQQFLSIDDSKGTAQEYEKQVEEKINAFISKLDKSTYEKVKPFLAYMFNLDSINTY